MMDFYARNEPRLHKETQIVRLRAFGSIGEAALEAGSEVTWDTLAGRYASRRRMRHVRVEASSGSFSATVLVQEGQKVKRGEVLAYYSYLFGLGYTEYTAPCDGEIAAISPAAGAISIKEAPVDLYCHLPGIVEKTDDAMGVWVRTYGDLVTAPIGAGYGRSGVLSVKATSPEAQIAARDLTPEDNGKVILAGRRASQEVLEACLKYRVAGIIVGSVSQKTFEWYNDLARSLDWDEFLARYWARDAKKLDEAPPPSEIVPALVVTEGYGDMPMGAESFAFLAAREGSSVYIDGGGNGSEEPAVVLPLNGGAVPKGWVPNPVKYLAQVRAGDKVIVFGLKSPDREGTVTELVSELRLEDDLVVPGARVDAEGGETVLVPLSNILLRG